jgi:hypothetical protein
VIVRQVKLRLSPTVAPGTGIAGPIGPGAANDDDRRWQLDPETLAMYMRRPARPKRARLLAGLLRSRVPLRGHDCNELRPPDGAIGGHLGAWSAGPRARRNAEPTGAGTPGPFVVFVTAPF